MDAFAEGIEVVAGIVVYNPLINRFLVLQSRYGFDLPKGHQEPGETARQTALRECFEETGLIPILVPNCHFAIQENGKRWFFFIGTVTTTEVHLSKEHDSGHWVPSTFASTLKQPLSDILRTAVVMLEIEDLFSNN